MVLPLCSAKNPDDAELEDTLQSVVSNDLFNSYTMGMSGLPDI